MKSIGIHIKDTDLSRKIYKYLFNDKYRERDLGKQKKFIHIEGELKFPQPLDELTSVLLLEWSNSFRECNKDWIASKSELRLELVEMFVTSWYVLFRSDNISMNETRKLQKYIRFALYRLSVLGLENILNSLFEILRKRFWLIRDPLSIIESLAQQGYASQLRDLLSYYYDFHQKDIEYLRAIIIRAIRFLPSLNHEDWNLIIKASTLAEGVPERLMATETWLYLGHKYSEFQQTQHIQSIKIALSSEAELPTRLKKNYLLLLGQFEPSTLSEFSINQNDPMLATAMDCALQGNPSEIFDSPELRELREQYYSGLGPTDTTQQGSP